jgi:hypothetical protein
MKDQVARAFADYLVKVYPGQKIEGTQLIELRRAFFAGCWLAYQKSDCANEFEAEQLDAIGEECKRFVQEVRAGMK